MVRNLIIPRVSIYALLVYGSICFGSAHTAEIHPSLSTDPTAILQTFFRKEGDTIIASAYFLPLTENEASTKIDTFMEYDTVSPKAVLEMLEKWHSRGGGIYEKKGLPHFFSVENPPKEKKVFWVAKIEHTGLLEEMLNFPKGFLRLEGDCAFIEIVNDKPLFLSNPTTIEKIRNQCLALKKFIVKTTSEGVEKSYIITEYKNDSFVYWNGWKPARAGEWIGKSLPLVGPGTLQEVKVEEIFIDLSEEDTYKVIYNKNKMIGRAIRFLSLISVLVGTCYIFRDKLDLFFKK